MRSVDDASQALLEDNEAIERGLHLLQDIVAALSFAVDALQTAQPSDPSEGVDFYNEVRRFEIALIKRTLKHTRGNQSRAARLLNLNQTTLHGKLKHYRISPLVIVYGEQESLTEPERSDSHENHSALGHADGQ